MLMDQQYSPENLHFRDFLKNASELDERPSQHFIQKMADFFKGITGPNFMTMNNSLCESYLPTIDEAPTAMGTMGIVLWVLGSLISIFLIVLFCRQCYFFYKTAHKEFRLDLVYVNSIFVVMAVLTSLGTGVPRAQALCSAFKDIYMCIGIAHFVDLTISMYGGQNNMTYRISSRIIDIRKLPLFWCCHCIPGCLPTKRAVSILTWLVWQMKWTQFGYYFIKIYILYSLQNSLGMVSDESSFAWFNIFNLISFLPGLGSLFVISSLVEEDLQHRFNYSTKNKVLRLTILTTKLQRILFDILGAGGVFPCNPPYVSATFYKNLLKDFIYLVEVLLLGIWSYLVYSRPGEFDSEPNDVELAKKNQIKSLRSVEDSENV